MVTSPRWTHLSFFPLNTHSPSSPLSCCCLPYLWSKARSSPSSRKSETESASSQVSCLWLWWSGRRTTCSPRRCGGTSCFSSVRRCCCPEERRPERGPAERASEDRGAAAAAGGDGGGAAAVEGHNSPLDTESHSAPHTLHSPPLTSRGCWWSRCFLRAPAALRGPGRRCWSRLGRWAPGGAAARCRTAAEREARIPGLFRPAAVPQPCLCQTHCHRHSHTKINNGGEKINR